VPTDPFVSPDPDDRPRQQQNLPPGTAMPPAGRWRPDRPGDLGPGQPRGPLLGTPAPNHGYAYTLVARTKDRLQLVDGEHVDDVLPVIAEIAAKRAALFGRAPVMRDVDVAVRLLDYEASVDDAFVEIRRLLVHGAGHDYYRRRMIVDSVPEELLRTDPDDLAAGVDEWRHATRARLFPELGRQPTA
jgi:hypothetical protein